MGKPADAVHLHRGHDYDGDHDNRVDAQPADKTANSQRVFVGGPRQVGKTTLARTVLRRADAGAYYSWDNRRDRTAALAGRWPPPPALIVLDELHKHRLWKRWLKGEYDTRGDDYRFLVTGSARLDVYRRGGDSLQGRYKLETAGYEARWNAVFAKNVSAETVAKLRCDPAVGSIEEVAFNDSEEIRLPRMNRLKRFKS